MAQAPILDVQDLRTYFFTRTGVVKAVDGVSFSLMPGETLGIVGESGCGKSMTALSIMGLVPQPAGRIVGGRILFQGEDLVPKSNAEMQHIRGQQRSEASRGAKIAQIPRTTNTVTGSQGSLRSRTLFPRPKSRAVVDGAARTDPESAVAILFFSSSLQSQPSLPNQT